MNGRLLVLGLLLIGLVGGIVAFGSITTVSAAKQTYEAKVRAAISE